MFCIKCGRPLPDDARFCGACGTPAERVLPPAPNGSAQEFPSLQSPQPPQPLQPAQAVKASQSIPAEQTPHAAQAAQASPAQASGKEAPPAYAPPEQYPPSFLPAGGTPGAYGAQGTQGTQEAYGPQIPPSGPRKPKKGLVAGLCVGGALLLIAAAAVVLFATGAFGGGKEDEKSENPGAMEDSSSIGSGGPGADTSPGRENAPGSAGTKAPPLPVLELDDGTEIFYGMEKSVLEEKQPDLENTFGPVYKLESGSLVGVYIREDEETGSETVAGWNTASSGTGPAGGLQVGDSYEKILEAYPGILSSQEKDAEATGREADPYDPETDESTYYTVYMDETGKIYTYSEYNKQVQERLLNGTLDRTQWFMLDFRVEGSRIAGISFGDTQMLIMMQ